MFLCRREFMGVSAGLAVAATAGSQGAPKLRLCIIGDTAQGGYGHSLHKAWELHDDVEVVALADPDEAGRKKAAEQARAQRTYADYAEMLQKERPDLVTIAPRWTSLHREYLSAAAAVGAHGFMEKPIAHNLTDADAMIRTIETKNLKWAAAFNFRVHPVVEHARKLVFEQGLIGDLLEIRARGKGDARAGGEDLLVLGIHIFDLMRYFLGNPTWCSANIMVSGKLAELSDARPASEPIGNVVGDRLTSAFGFAGGVIGTFASAKNNGGNSAARWGVDLCGSKGVVSLRPDYLDSAGYFPEPAWGRSAQNVQWQPLPDAPSAELESVEAETYRPITVDLIQAIRRDRKPTVSLQDGRDALEMVQAVYASHFKAARVALPLKDRIHPIAEG